MYGNIHEIEPYNMQQTEANKTAFLSKCMNKVLASGEAKTDKEALELCEIKWSIEKKLKDSIEQKKQALKNSEIIFK